MDTNQDASTETVVVEQKRWSVSCGFLLIVLVVLALLGGGAATVGAMVVFRQESPAPGEEFIADLAKRTIIVPGEYHDLRVPANADLPRGRELYLAECAICHGDTGKGDGFYGKTQYPPAADLTASSVQSKTDGQLYWFIAHGINLTGMPAFGEDFGGVHNDEEIWHMVKFIREELGK